MKTEDYHITTATDEHLVDIYVPKFSEWKCYLFGAQPGSGLTYQPTEGNVPNWFIRWMMKVCFACMWVKE